MSEVKKINKTIIIKYCGKGRKKKLVKINFTAR